MEQAFVLPDPEADWPAATGRIYFGAEFCGWACPSPAAVAAVWRRAHAAGLPVTLLLPVMPESFRPRLQELLADLGPLATASDEVAISDWGALAAVRKALPGVRVVLGRALSGQKRGPQILELELSEAALDSFRRGSWYGREARALLAEEEILRIELDNLPQGLAPLPAGLKASLHHPYAMVTSSRNCPYHAGLPTGDCQAPCRPIFKLSSPRSPLPLLQRGNTQFIALDHLPDNLSTLGIDRLVFHPRLPR